MNRPLVALCGLALCLAVSTHAMHEDEQGKFDWFRQGLGFPTLAAFHPPSKTLKSVYVASRQNAIASFGTKRGEMRWRHVLGIHDNITCLQAFDRGVIVGTVMGTLLSIDPVTGAVLRTFALEEGGVVGCGTVSTTTDNRKDEDSLVVVTSALEATEDGNLRVSTTSPATTILTIPASDVRVLRQIKTASWASIKHPVLAATVFSTGTIAAVIAPEVAEERRQLAVADIASLDSAPSTTPLPAEMEDGAAVFTAVRDGKAFLALRDSDFLVYAVDASAKVVTEVPRNEDTLVGPKGAVPTLLAFQASSSSKAGGQVPENMLMRYSTGTVQLLRPDAAAEGGVTASWTYEGSFGEVSHIEIVPPSASNTREGKFGLNDHLVLCSRSGVLFGARSSSNDTEWVAYPAADAASMFPKECAQVQSRPVTYEVLGLSATRAIASVRILCKPRQTTTPGSIVQLSYNVVNGDRAAATVAAATAASYPLEGVVMGSDHTAVDSGASAVGATPLYYHTLDTERGVAEGFVLEEGTANGKAAKMWQVNVGGPILASASGSSDLRAVSSVEHMRYLMNETAGVKDIRRKYPTANTLVLCYSEPETIEDAAGVHDGEAGIPTLVVVAIDTISGQVLGSMRHTNVEGSVSVIIAEHMILYSFLSIDTMHTKVAVWELFESQDTVPKDNQYTSPALIVMSFLEKRRTFSALTTRPPYIQTQLLSFPHGEVASMGVTVTTQGIARKLVVFATTEGSVLTVPLNQLAIGGSQPPAAAAGKPLPKGTLFVPPTQFVTYVHRVHQPRQVFSFPTPLESTSHLIVVGLDMFYVRASSGKPFDIFDEDFNRPALIAGCVGLPLAVLVFRYIAQRRMLALAWA